MRYSLFGVRGRKKQKRLRIGMRRYVAPDSDPAYFHRSIQNQRLRYVAPDSDLACFHRSTQQHQTPHRNAELRGAGLRSGVLSQEHTEPETPLRGAGLRSGMLSQEHTEPDSASECGATWCRTPIRRTFTGAHSIRLRTGMRSYVAPGFSLLSLLSFR